MYHLEIDTNITFDSKIYNDSTLAGVSNIITGLANATKYYWRVSVKDSATSGGGTGAFLNNTKFYNVEFYTDNFAFAGNTWLDRRICNFVVCWNQQYRPISIIGNVGLASGRFLHTGFGTPNVVGTIYEVSAGRLRVR